MFESLYDKLRGKQRFSVEIKASYTIKGRGGEFQECLITDLSLTGAAVRLPLNERPAKGMVLLLHIPIPSTIMHVAAEVEVVWTRQGSYAWICGVKFMNALSDGMLQKLLPQPADAKPSAS